jgi:hypothetical protein
MVLMPLLSDQFHNDNVLFWYQTKLIIIFSLFIEFFAIIYESIIEAYYFCRARLDGIL